MIVESIENDNRSNNIPRNTIIKIICETTTSFKFLLNFKFSDITTYEDLICHLHVYLSTLDFDNISIIL